MKKLKSEDRGSAAKAKRLPLKAKPVPGTVDEYLGSVSESSRNNFIKLRAAIRSAVPPEAVEVISYRIPAIKYKGILLWFGAFSSHCSLFPTAEVIKMFKDDLKHFSVSKGTIHFPSDRPLPTVLIKKIVKARVARKESK